VDFYCAELRVAIELDGGYHGVAEQQTRDSTRAEVLRARGVRILRVENSRVNRATLLTLIQPLVPPLRVRGEGDRG